MTAYIQPHDLWQHLQREPAPLVLDVRGAEEYAAGHVPGARHLPVDQITAHLAELPPDRLIVPY